MPSSRRSREVFLSISERLSDRLLIARKAFDRRFNALPPNRRHSAQPLPSLANDDESTRATREHAVLRTVFREFGDVHRQYRYRTGKAGTPELRAAAVAFKESPSEQSLLPVAEMLDELKLLAW